MNIDFALAHLAVLIAEQREQVEQQRARIVVLEAENAALKQPTETDAAPSTVLSLHVFAIGAEVLCESCGHVFLEDDSPGGGDRYTTEIPMATLAAHACVATET